MTDLYTWSGRYVGFVRNGTIFDKAGAYRGWIEQDGTAWADNGQFIGKLTAENYILRNQSSISPIPKIPRVPAIPAIPQIPRINRIGRIPMMGHVDALENFFRET